MYDVYVYVCVRVYSIETDVPLIEMDHSTSGGAGGVERAGGGRQLISDTIEIVMVKTTLSSFH